MSAAPPVTVRPAVPGDREALGRMAGELVRFHHELDAARFLPGVGVEAGYGRWLIRETENPAAVVLVAEGEVEGARRVVGYTYSRVEERNWNELVGAHGKLHDVFVDASVRRSGVARALVLATLEALRAKGAPQVLLTTAVANDAAQRLFASLGLRPTMLEMSLTL